MRDDEADPAVERMRMQLAARPIRFRTAILRDAIRRGDHALAQHVMRETLETYGAAMAVRLIVDSARRDEDPEREPDDDTPERQ